MKGVRRQSVSIAAAACCMCVRFFSDGFSPAPNTHDAGFAPKFCPSINRILWRQNNEVLLPTTPGISIGVRISKFFCAKASVADRVNRSRLARNSATGCWPAYLLHLVAHFSKSSTSTNPTTRRTPKPLPLPPHSTKSQPSWIFSRKSPS